MLNHFSIKTSFYLLTWLVTWSCEMFVIVSDHICDPPPPNRTTVFQSTVSLKSLGLDWSDPEVFSAAPAELGVIDDLTSLESAAGEPVVPASSGPWSEDSCRNSGISSCSLVKRPRWSSTLQPWAFVSISRNPDTHTHMQNIMLMPTFVKWINNASIFNLGKAFKFYSWEY